MTARVVREWRRDAQEGQSAVEADSAADAAVQTDEEVECTPESERRGLDARAPPFYPSVAMASVAAAVGVVAGSR